MLRIATATRAVDLHGAGKDGFTEGVPLSGTPPTQLSATWFNDVQEALARAIENAGLALAADTNTQLLRAIEALSRDMRFNATYDDEAELWHHVDPTADAHRLQFVDGVLTYYVHAAPGTDIAFAAEDWEQRPVPLADLGAAAGAGAQLRYYWLDGAHRWTINARRDGANWVQDDDALSSTELALGAGTLALNFLGAGAGTFDDGDWTLVFALASSDAVMPSFGCPSINASGQIAAARLAATADPAGSPAPSTIYSSNIEAAWGLFTTNGAGGFSASQHFGCTIEVDGTSVLVTLANAMALGSFPVVGNANGALLAPCLLVPEPVSDSKVRLHVWPRSGAEVDLSTSPGITVAFRVAGKAAV